MLRFQLLRGGITLEHNLRTFLDRPGDKSADALAFPFGCSRHHLMNGVVQVSGHRMWKALPRPPTFAPIAFWRHEQILLAPH